MMQPALSCSSTRSTRKRLYKLKRLLPAGWQPPQYHTERCWSVQSPVPEQRFDLRLTAAEVKVHLFGIHDSHLLKHILPERSGSCLIKQALLVECLEGIIVKHCSPGVHIVAGIVAVNHVQEIGAPVSRLDLRYQTNLLHSPLLELLRINLHRSFK